MWTAEARFIFNNMVRARAMTADACRKIETECERQAGRRRVTVAMVAAAFRAH